MRVGLSRGARSAAALAGAVWLSLARAGLAGTAGVATPEALGRELAGLVESSAAPGATWGVHVVALESGRVLFSTNAGRLLVPASNTKLLTVAAALDRFGPAHRFGTTLAAGAGPRDGVLAGDLVVIGRGDPGPPGRRVPGGADPLAPWVQAIRAAGIREIAGRVRVSDRGFPGGPAGAGWNWDDLPEAYGAPVSGVAVHDSCVTVRVTGGTVEGAPVEATLEPPTRQLGLRVRATTAAAQGPLSVRVRRLPGMPVLEVAGSLPARRVHAERMAVPDGEAFFGEQLAAALAAQGVRVAGGFAVERVDRDAPATVPVVLAEVPSRPLAKIAADCLKPSDNRVAHLLLLAMGRDARERPRAGEGERDDEAAGVAVVQRFLRRAGIQEHEATLEEGSGLSRKNLVTPSALVRLLAYMERHPHAAAWRDALPEPGADGTLRHRLADLPATARLRAKTGTLRQLHSLAGTLSTARGDRLAFAILVNGYLPSTPGSTARAEMDALVGGLARYGGPVSGGAGR
ncbi:MAG: D-alanyl-D-alanine carboxypeptidase/D-alanyl-D-alanine-endopeptidase [Verrucomicrobiota bacterium]